MDVMEEEITEASETNDLQQNRKGSLFSYAVKFLIRSYQLCIRPYLGYHCRFFPSCSEYALEAINKYGVLRGGRLALKRLMKCHPWHPGGPDLP